MEFNNIKKLLKRFKNLEPDDAYIKDAIIAVIEELFDEKIERNEMEVQKGTIYLRVHPALKSEIYIKKTRTLELINKKLEKNIVKNIV